MIFALAYNPLHYIFVNFIHKFFLKEEKRGIRERLLAVQDTLAMVQNALDFIASSMERFKK